MDISGGKSAGSGNAMVIIYPPKLRGKLNDGRCCKILLSGNVSYLQNVLPAGSSSVEYLLRLLEISDKNLKTTSDGPNGEQLETHVFIFEKKTVDFMRAAFATTVNK